MAIEPIVTPNIPILYPVSGIKDKNSIRIVIYINNKLCHIPLNSVFNQLGKLSLKDKIDVPYDINAYGIPSDNTYLRGDGIWSTISESELPSRWINIKNESYEDNNIRIEIVDNENYNMKYIINFYRNCSISYCYSGDGDYGSTKGVLYSFETEPLDEFESAANFIDIHIDEENIHYHVSANMIYIY